MNRAMKGKNAAQIVDIVRDDIMRVLPEWRVCHTFKNGVETVLFTGLDETLEIRRKEVKR